MLEAINQRLFDLYTHVGGDLRLFALIDGVQMEHLTGSFPARGEHSRALFDATLEGALGDAGPWLLQVDKASVVDLSKLDKLSASADGTIALLRYYRTSVLTDLAQTLQPLQRTEFFAPALQWFIYRQTGLALVHGFDTPSAT